MDRKIINNTGVLLPVASLPNGKFSLGYSFVDWLAKNNYKYWQILPLHPRDYFKSPYNTDDPFKIDPEYGTEKEWQSLKKYANKLGIKIIGDVPFFVKKCPKDLAIKGFWSGAPPDQYSKKGQWWGHPLYNWEEKFDQNLDYFLKRIHWAVLHYDLVRLDHFRGFEAVWAIPKPYKSGKRGTWLPVPGEKILAALIKKFPKTEFIAEDLGIITPAVTRLRKKFKLLGSAVIQFGENHNEDIVYYTSNHDTQTLVGKYKKGSEKYFQKVINSRAEIIIIPMWDVLKLGNEARLNKPGKKNGNWGWSVDQEYNLAT